MTQAIEQAGLEPDAIDVVYAAANSSGLDAVEARALSGTCFWRTTRGSVRIVEAAAG